MVHFTVGAPIFVFCPVCDYVESTAVRNRLAFAADTKCPRCHGPSLADFYEYGSETHRERRAGWERGEIVGAPLPVPAVWEV